MVTDARLRTAVTVIRSLGRTGVSVSAAEASGLSRVLGFRSRYARARVFLGENAHKNPGPQDLDMILEACGPGGVIIPVHSPFVFMLSRKSQELRGGPISLFQMKIHSGPPTTKETAFIWRHR